MLTLGGPGGSGGSSCSSGEEGTSWGGSRAPCPPNVPHQELSRQGKLRGWESLEGLWGDLGGWKSPWAIPSAFWGGSHCLGVSPQFCGFLRFWGFL